MLVYYDPWLAGVVFPSLIIVGPDGDPLHRHQPEGERLLHRSRSARSRSTLFLFGFLILWVLLVILGTFLRGPNWNFFGPYEYWDLHKLRGPGQRQPLGVHLGQGVLTPRLPQSR
mgnify:CR=1 FL=1